MSLVVLVAPCHNHDNPVAPVPGKDYTPGIAPMIAVVPIPPVAAQDSYQQVVVDMQEEAAVAVDMPEMHRNSGNLAMRDL